MKKINTYFIVCNFLQLFSESGGTSEDPLDHGG
jgi:hypothetical protein